MTESIQRRIGRADCFWSAVSGCFLQVLCTIDVGMHEDLYEIFIKLPGLPDLNTGDLAWTSTWESVLEVEHAANFERSWTAEQHTRNLSELRELGVSIASIVAGTAVTFCTGKILQHRMHCLSFKTFVPGTQQILP